VKNAVQHLCVLAYCGTLKQEKEVSDKMQASVQPPHNELLYQGYVTEELEKSQETSCFYGHAVAKPRQCVGIIE